MACITGQDGGESEQRIDQAGMPNPQPPTCRVYRSKSSRGEHTEYNIVEGDEYFFLLVTPTDPGAFAGVSSVASPALRPLPPAPSPLLHQSGMAVSQTAPAVASSGPEPQNLRVNSLPKSSGPDTDHEELDNDQSHSDFDSLSARPAWARRPHKSMPGGYWEARERERNRAAARNAQEGSFCKCLAANLPDEVLSHVLTSDLVAFGPRLDALDVFKIDRDRWYEVKNSENVQAVIGILAGEKLLSGEPSKKRRRVG